MLEYKQMVEFGKPYLKKILQRLFYLQMSCGSDFNTNDALQEMLDFLCMARGIKPVFVAGRGIDNPCWVSGIIQLAQESGFYLEHGNFWDAYEWPEDIPTWYVKDTLALLEPFNAVYITRIKKIKNEVKEICSRNGKITMEDEARLLAYPKCCVQSHYLRLEGWYRAILSILDRHCDGNEVLMQKLLASEKIPPPETDEEKLVFSSAYNVFPAKFGSWNMCAKCRSMKHSPSALQIKKNYNVGMLIGSKLIEMLTA